MIFLGISSGSIIAKRRKFGNGERKTLGESVQNSFVLLNTGHSALDT
jgi:hypothetical protein